MGRAGECEKQSSHSRRTEPGGLARDPQAEVTGETWERHSGRFWKDFCFHPRWRNGARCTFPSEMIGKPDNTYTARVPQILDIRHRWGADEMGPMAIPDRVPEEERCAERTPESAEGLP